VALRKKQTTDLLRVPKSIFQKFGFVSNSLESCRQLLVNLNLRKRDIFCRYKTLKGFQVQRKAGWDTHGLPVELSVEKALGITKEDIGIKISVEEYNKACRKTVMQYTDVWNNLTEKNGLLGRHEPSLHHL